MVTCPLLQIHIVLLLRWDFTFPILPLTLYLMNQWRPLSLLTHLLCLMWKTSRRNPRKRNTPRKCGLAKNRCILSLSNHTLLLDCILSFQCYPHVRVSKGIFLQHLQTNIACFCNPLPFLGGRGYSIDKLACNGNKFHYWITFSSSVTCFESHNEEVRLLCGKFRKYNFLSGLYLEHNYQRRIIMNYSGFKSWSC